MILQGIALTLIGAALLCYGAFMLLRPRAYQRFVIRSFERSWLRGFWREAGLKRVSAPGYVVQIVFVAMMAVAFGLGSLWAGGILLGLW